MVDRILNLMPGQKYRDHEKLRLVLYLTVVLGFVAGCAIGILILLGFLYVFNRIPDGAVSLALISGGTLAGVFCLLWVFWQRGMRAAAEESAVAQERDAERIEAVQASLEYRFAERTRELSATASALQTAADIARVAVSAGSLAEQLPRVASEIAKSFGCYHVGIYLPDDSGGQVALEASGGIGGVAIPDLGYRVPTADGSVMAECARDWSVKLAFAGDVPPSAQALGPDALSVHRARLPETEVEIVLPLTVGESLVGLVDMHISDLSALYQQSLEPLRIMADQLAVAIQSVCYLQQRQTGAQDEPEQANQFSRRRGSWLSASDIVPGYSFRGDRVVPIGETWYPEMAAALTKDERVVVREPDGNSRAANADAQSASHAEDGGGVVAVPIRARDQTMGVLHLRKRQGAGGWDARELEQLDILTHQLESALESAQLYRETQHAANQQRTVAEVGARVREEGDIESILARALAELGSALAADQGAVLLTLDEPGEDVER